MKKGSTVLLVIIAVIIVIALALGGIYNSIVTLEENVNSEFSNVSVMLERRADLIPNLVSTVKGYASHEQAAIDSVTKARENLLQAKTIEEKGEANNELTSALNALMVIVENYPDLKANQNFLDLQASLEEAENKITYSRQFYNDNVLNYNNKTEMFPSNIIANIFNFEKFKFFEASEKDRETPKVQF